MKRTGFKFKPRKPLKRTRIRVVGHSDTADQKREIQALLRQITILRDKGCVMRHHPETGKCGGYTKNGELILQFDHLNSRVHAISFSDPRLGICVCQRHHIHFKPQYPFEYERTAIAEIGPERARLLSRVREDRTPHKADLKLEAIVLRQELRKMEQEEHRYLFEKIST